jgi:hypothetical protein
LSQAVEILISRDSICIVRVIKVADDRDHLALAINYRGSRSSVIEYEAIVAVIQLKERRADELVIDPVFHKSTVCNTQATVRIGDAHHALVRYERLRPDRKKLGTEKWSPQFEHGYLLGVGTHETQEADRN